MAVNFPGPYVLDFEYNVLGLTHHIRHSCDVDGSPVVGADPATVDLHNKGGTVTDMATWTEALLDVVAAIYNSSNAEFFGSTLFSYDQQTGIYTYVTQHSYPIMGGSATAVHEAGQIIYTFRSTNGGVARFVMLESSVVGNDQASMGNLPSTAQENIRDTLLGNTSPVIARDNGFFALGMKYSPSENEALFRRRYRS